MSPGAGASGQDDLDHRADIYALGVILYECLTGEVPFRGVNYLSVLVAGGQPSRCPRRGSSDQKLQLSDGVDRVVGKAMAKAREDRYQTMAAFEADLARLAQGRRVEAERVETRERRSGARRGRFGWGAGAVLAGGVLLITVLSMGWLLRSFARQQAAPRRREQPTRAGDDHAVGQAEGGAVIVDGGCPCPERPARRRGAAGRSLARPLAGRAARAARDHAAAPGRGARRLSTDVDRAWCRAATARCRSTSAARSAARASRRPLPPLSSRPAMTTHDPAAPGALPTSDETLPNPY